MKKIIALVLALSMMFAFAACAKDTSASSGEKKSEWDGQTLVMGASCDFAPYESIGDDGEPMGIDVDIATAICEKLGATLEIKDMDFDGIIAAVEGKSINFGMSGMTVTEERKESVNFSTPYETAVQAILVLDGSTITGPDDLKGKLIGVQQGTTGDLFCQDEYGADNVKPYKKYSLAVEALKQGLVDAVVLDGPVAEEFAKAAEESESAKLKVLDTACTQEEYAIAFNKEDTALMEAFNEALAELEADGTIDAIYAKYED